MIVLLGAAVALMTADVQRGKYPSHLTGKWIKEQPRTVPLLNTQTGASKVKAQGQNLGVLFM